MPDLDQGGHPRRTSRTDLGPSVGWAETPYRSLLQIGMAGIYSIDPSINLVTVATASLVVLILPHAQMPTSGPTAQPQLFLGPSIQIVDAGGLPARLCQQIQRLMPEPRIVGRKAPSGSLCRSMQCRCTRRLGKPKCV